ncbi:MAG TPA: hypothetical protein VGP01_06705 [Rhizomicrobium sp.]|nr:hypothetical protein [Rhizomicrobium sp.]
MRLHVLVLIVAGLGLVCSSADAADACFAASKTYHIRPLLGGQDTKDGWAVEGAQFAQCVRRAESADKALHARYPDTVYNLSLAATIGCHSPCG